MKKILKFIKNTDGQSLVESALVLSFVLIPLILGVIEFGWILNGKITLTNAAREGTRAAVVCVDYDTAKAAATAAAEKYKGISSLSTVEIKEGDFTFSAGTATVKVTATIKPIVGLFFKTDVTLTAKAQMRIE